MFLCVPTRLYHHTPLACVPSSERRTSKPPSRSLPGCCQVPCHRRSAIFAVTKRPPCWVYGPLPFLSSVALYRFSSSTSRISHSPLTSGTAAAASLLTSFCVPAAIDGEARGPPS